MFGFDITKILATESFIGCNSIEVSISAEDQADEIVEGGNMHIPIGEDQIPIWMCSTYYQRYENEEESENCVCIDLE